MKNIEKYNETKCALDAYNQSKSKNIPFDEWLELEYKEPRMQTLLEAAEKVTTVWKSKMPEGSLTNLWNAIVNLSEAIEREKKKPVKNFEKKKPVRNFDKYKTADDAYEAYEKFCYKSKCLECRYRYRYPICRFAWLYDEVEK